MDHSDDFEILNPQKLTQLREDMLMQLLAVLIRRVGGEVSITSQEFGTAEGIEIIARQVTPEHLKLYLVSGCFDSEEEEEEDSGN